MIPKIIHYCWFGGNPLPANLEKYVDGWSSKLPGYEIKKWDELNFDVNISLFIRQAYENRKWAFVSDYVRMSVLYEYGGIYLDTDIEMIKDFSPLLNYPMLLGYEASGSLQAGVIGAEKGSQYTKMILDYYNGSAFIGEDGNFDLEPVGVKIEKVLKQRFDFVEQGNPFLLDRNILICPSRYLCPDLITEVGLSDNYSIHHGEGSWLPASQKFKQKLFLFIVRNRILVSLYRYFKRKE